MASKAKLLVIVLGLFGLSQPASAAVITLFGQGINIDGTTTCRSIPGGCMTSASDFTAVSGVDGSGFDFTTGLGTVDVTITGTGTHNVDLFFDHDIDRAVNTFFNEIGATSGTAAAGQSWEIDEPGFFPPGNPLGDIASNFRVSALENVNSLPVGSDDDVSMALGWDFLLAASETAFISFLVSETMPTGGFFLSQTDPDSAAPATIYFSSSLTITAVPEPGTLALFGLGLTGLGFARRKRLI